MTKMVREVLTGARSIDMDRNDRNAYDALTRRHYAPDQRALLSPALLELADDPDVRPRAAAVLFHRALYTDPTGLLLELLNNHVELFEGFQDPWYGEEDLRRVLVAAVARTLSAGDPETAMVKAEALEPGGGGLVGYVSRWDPPWLAAHAAQIVTASPTALVSVVMNSKGGALSDVVRDLRTAVPEGVLRTTITNCIPAGAARDRALEALDR